MTIGSRILCQAMKVLNVAEKNDAAKRIAGLLANGNTRTLNGVSKFNKIYEFTYTWPLNNQQVTMAMTSVSGHVIGYDFTQQFRPWHSCDPVSLFEAPVEKICQQTSIDTMRNLEKQAPYAQILVIWTDCDREGENIGYEVIDICTAINPRLQIYRAKFSEITPTAVNRAMQTLVRPNKRVSDAVDVRQVLDLRIGAAFTRFQTLRLQRRFPAALAAHIVSYGSCQFPTLGFVVERYKAIQNFVPEYFWKIEVKHKHPEQGTIVDFNWARVRLFNEHACSTLLEKCQENPTATVRRVTSKPKNKWRPVALDTVEFEKLASRKLKISAKEAMRVAEKLYTAGIISYPRTETNIFPKGLHLQPLVEMQARAHGAPWAAFAAQLAATGQPNPRNGRKSDQAHPPIHPTRYDGGLTGNDKRIYELIVRHFLACCSKDAVGQETTVEIEIAEECFVANGLTVLERNYLDVYPYDRWSDKEIPRYMEGQRFQPTKIEQTESQTTGPQLLTEADLIALMEKHGIGTDATHAEHIEKIKGRMYVGVQDDGRFVPGQLGMGLVEGYDAMGFHMSKPHLRAELEADLQKIIDGTKQPDVVLREQVQKYKAVFVEAMNQVNKLDEAVGQYINPHNPGNQPPGHGFGGGGGGGMDDDDDDDQGFGGSGGGRFDTGNNRNNENEAPAPRRSPQRPTNPRGGGRGGGGSPPKPPPTFGRPAAGAGAFDQPKPAPLCNCRMPSIQFTVKKKSENEGRRFYKCEENVCGYFKWYDEAHPDEPFVPGQAPQTSAAPTPGPDPARPAAATQRGVHTMSTSTTTFHPTTTNSRQPQQPPHPTVAARPEPLCNCKAPAMMWTTKKQTQNFGRRFYTCGGPDKDCNFFKWYDEVHPDEPWLGPGNAAAPPQNNYQVPAPGPSAPRGGGSRGRGRGARGGGGAADQFLPRMSNTGGRGAGNTGARPPKRPPTCGICRQVGHTKKQCPERDFEDDDEMDAELMLIDC